MRTIIQIIKTIPLLLLFILCFSRPALCFNGAKLGCQLWLNTILPALLPMCILSSLLIHTNCIYLVSDVFAPIFCPLFGISKQACYPVLIGFLTGFPLGAKTTCELLSQECISKQEAQYLISFANNPSPMYLLIVIPAYCKNDYQIHYSLYLIILLSSMICSILSRFFYISPQQSVSYPGENTTKHSLIAAFDQAITSSFQTLIKIAGYIIVFSVFANYTSHSLLPMTLRTIISSLLEMTSGTATLYHSSFSPQTKIILTMACATSGGFSGLFQTRSVIAGSGLSFKQYCTCKLMQTVIVVLFTYFLVIA